MDNIRGNAITFSDSETELYNSDSLEFDSNSKSSIKKEKQLKQEECSKFDDFGIKITNNYTRGNMQRKSNDTIKERRFFKTLPENPTEIVDVNKVFKLISNNKSPEVIDDLFKNKSPKSTVLKTYCNKRKHFYNDCNNIVESFGLPDEPIVPLNVNNSPIKQIIDKKIDIDVNITPDVNITQSLDVTAFLKKEQDIPFNNTNLDLPKEEKPSKNILDYCLEQKSFDTLLSFTPRLKSLRHKMNQALGVDITKKLKNNGAVETSIVDDKVEKVEIKRSIGRPRKIKVKTDEVVVKRPRGRPRKYFTDNNTTANIISDNGELSINDSLSNSIDNTSKSLNSSSLIDKTNENTGIILESSLESIDNNSFIKSEATTPKKGKKQKSVSPSPKRRSGRSHPSSILLDISDKIDDDDVTIETNEQDIKTEEIEPENDEEENELLKEFNQLPKKERNRLSHFKRRSGRLHPSSILLDIREDKFEIKPSKSRQNSIDDENKKMKETKENKNRRKSITEQQQTQKILRSSEIKDLVDLASLPKRKKSMSEKSPQKRMQNEKPLQNEKSPEKRLQNEKSPEKRLQNEKSPEKRLQNGKSSEEQLQIKEESSQKQLQNEKSPQKQLRSDSLKNNQKSQKKNSLNSIKSPSDENSKKLNLCVVLNPLAIQNILNSSQESLSSPPKKKLRSFFEKSPNIPTITSKSIKKKLNISQEESDIDETKQKRKSDSKTKPKEIQEKTKKPTEADEEQFKEDDQISLDDFMKKYNVGDFNVGDLAWARIGSYPFWPCIIVEDPMSKSHKTLLPSEAKQVLFHVRFFADKGRRAWVKDKCLMLYHSSNDLKRIRRKFTKAMRDENKMVNPSILKSCILKESKHHQMKKWNQAINEAEILYAKPIETRTESFEELLKLYQKSKEEEKLMKKAEKEKSIKTEPNDNIDINNKKRTRLSLDNQQQQQNEQPPSKKLKLNNSNSKKDSIDCGISDNQSIIDIKKDNNNISSLNSDTDSKFSDNSSSVPPTLESQAALYKRNNIFRGIPKEKICQICRKNGETFKCKGQCSGIYHIACAIKPNLKIETNTTDSQQQSSQSLDSSISSDNDEDDDDLLENSQVEIVSLIPKNKNLLPNLQIHKTEYNSKMSLEEKIDFEMKALMQQNMNYNNDDDLSCDEEFIVERPKSRAEKKKQQIPIIKHVTADSIDYSIINDNNKRKIDDNNTKVHNNNNNNNLGSNNNDKKQMNDLRCDNCTLNRIPPCLICKKDVSKSGDGVRQKCCTQQCGKFYHTECLKLWPQTHWSLINNTKQSSDSFVCPRHVCHTCISDDPRAANSRCSSDKVVKCLNCPATYHSSSYCVPAGTLILSTSQIICPRHFNINQKHKNHKFNQTVNANWCFICSKGGDLICCETCPTSVHIECLPIDNPKDMKTIDTFFCEDCQSGRLPLYDEIVWVKLGRFRWWPAVILFPNDIPDNVKNVPHGDGEFAVKFFGTYNYHWVGRGRAFLFQEGDKGQSLSGKKRVDHAFNKAVEEAATAHSLKKKFKISKVAEKNSCLKPPPYIRIKVNKPVGNVRLFDGNTSNTTSCDCDPTTPHPCGPDSDCLNRLLLTECNPEVCPAGERCNNQCFEKREYPPLVPHHTQERGWGLKTLAPIRKGQFVIEYVGEMIDEQEYQRRIQRMHEQKEENYYFLTIDNQRMLDAGPKGNVARFMNHSCDPNCETQKWTVNGDTRVGLFATCDIPAGTELTFNYNLECIGKEKKICKCGAANCSGFIGVKAKTVEPPKQKKKTIKLNKKPNVPKSPEPVKDNPCFVCGKLGDVGACANKICTKYYHLECVHLNSWPDGGKWVCPWHNCNFCSKRTIRCCVKCINSYCPPHSDGNVRYDKLLGFVCSEHDPTKESIAVPNTPEYSPDIVSDDSAISSTTQIENNEETVEKPNEEDLVGEASKFEVMENTVTSTPLKEKKDIPEPMEIDISLNESKKNSKLKDKSPNKSIKKKKNIEEQGRRVTRSSLQNQDEMSLLERLNLI